MKKSEKREIIEVTYMSKPNAVKTEYKGTIFYQYSYNDKLAMAVLPANLGKTSEHYLYKTAEILNARIEKLKQQIDNNEIEKAKYTAKFDAAKAEIKAGDIFYTSWGYEQTNINFYKVTERKNDTVTVVELGQIKSYERDDCGQTEPNLDRQGEPFKKRLNKYGGFNINSFASASKWDGKKLYWSSYY